MILLKDVSGAIDPSDTLTREKRIQGGEHYSEMLPIEYEPTEEYMRCYKTALMRFAPITAQAVCRVSRLIVAEKGENGTLVSLARAGISAGILIKRFVKMKYGYDYPHYAVSIIRDRGIDHNAMRYILGSHQSETLQFIDGWTGKGVILQELRKALASYPCVSSDLAVLADPSHITRLCGTREDFLIPSACLNATISGLISRTVLNDLIIGNDFHGAVFYGNLNDLTYEFIDAAISHFSFDDVIDYDDVNCVDHGNGIDEVQKIAADFGITDINLVKPGIGEATRVLLRRLPWKMLVKSLDDTFNLGHLYQLAKEKNIPLLEYPLLNYRAVGIIKTMGEV
jgi:hypothetical protein